MDTIRAARKLKLPARKESGLQVLFLALATALTLIGFGIRLHNLGGDSLWLDEQLTVQTARLGFPEVLTGARDHPPLIYLLTSIAIRQFGETEFTARLVSLLAGALAIPLIMLFGRVMGRPYAGLWAGLFLAFSPLHLKYSQESRHYALLMTISLASYILLVVAMQRSQLRYWIGFGVLTALNLYVHYGAFIVLGTQLLLICLWMLWQLRRSNYKQPLWPVLAVIIALILYLPWMSNFLASLDINTGATNVSDTGGMASISQWAREAFYSFGMYYDWLPYGLLALALIGLLILVVQRDLLTAGIVISGIALPFLLIQVASVARGAFARYLIYVLPIYLIAAAVTPATILTTLSLRWGRRVGLASAIIGAILFVVVAAEPVRREHVFIQDDWRGIVRYLDQTASADDVLATFSLRGARGFNNVGSSLPYYLDREANQSYVFLNGNHLRQRSVLELQTSSGKVWIILFDPLFDLEAVQAMGLAPRHFQAHLYVMPYEGENETVLEQVTSVYEKLIPAADRPSPRCYMEKDLSLLYAQSGDFAAAERRLSSALAACPDQMTGFNIAYGAERDILNVVYEGAVASYVEGGDIEGARRVARTLLQYDARNETALAALADFDLLEVYQQGGADEDIEDPSAPIEIREFVMPQTGDAGEVLFVHPPNEVSFSVGLPEEPLHFYTRVALDPASWEWGGDGATFVLAVTKENGDTIELLEQYVSNGPEDRRWHDIDVSLEQFAGRSIILTLRTEPGPAGDFTGDWAGWETPRIMQEIP